MLLTLRLHQICNVDQNKLSTVEVVGYQHSAVWGLALFHNSVDCLLCSGDIPFTVDYDISQIPEWTEGTSQIKLWFFSHFKPHKLFLHQISAAAVSTTPFNT